jgi:hypothetical protein
MELIKTPQKSSETLINIADHCLQSYKLGVGGNLRGLQLSTVFIRDLHIIIKSLYVQLHLPFKMLYDASGTWRLLQAMILLLGACHGEKNKGNKKTSEVVKSLQLIGCSYCKALTLNLLHKLLPILTVLLGGDGNHQVRNRGMKCIVLQQQDLYSCSRICGALGGLEQGNTSNTLVTKAS